MSGYDYDRPYITVQAMDDYVAIDPDVARDYGMKIKATELSNSEYHARFLRFGTENNMRPPPSAGRKYVGYLVVRKLGLKKQYETWMPDHVFEELYMKP